VLYSSDAIFWINSEASGSIPLLSGSIKSSSGFIEAGSDNGLTESSTTSILTTSSILLTNVLNSICDKFCPICNASPSEECCSKTFPASKAM